MYLDMCVIYNIILEYIILYCSMFSHLGVHNLEAGLVVSIFLVMASGICLSRMAVLTTAPQEQAA